MELAARLSTAGQFVELLRLACHDSDIPGTLRARVGAACLALSQEHHHAIVLLTENRLYGSAFALLRSVFEAYVRGEWLLHTATDEQVQSFADGAKPPRLERMVSAVEERLRFEEGNLSGVVATRWDAMCAYTHTGGLHVQRWQREESVEPTYDESEVNEMLMLAELLAAVSAVSLLGLANREGRIVSIMNAVAERNDA